MDFFDKYFVPNYSDKGARYRYEAQPKIFK